jgi:hypothetical protein
VLEGAEKGFRENGKLSKPTKARMGLIGEAEEIMTLSKMLKNLSEPR